MCPLLFVLRSRGQRSGNRRGSGGLAEVVGAEKKAAPTRLREECLAGAVIRAASGTGGTGVAALHTQRDRRRGVPQKRRRGQRFFYRAPRESSRLEPYRFC